MDAKVTVSAVVKKMLAPSFPAEVLRLSLLAALVLACTQGGFFAYELSGKACCDPSSSFLPCYKLRPAAVGVAGSLKLGIVRCSVPQGAAAALALLLKGRRRRRALAFVSLAAATASNCMYARMIGFVDAPVDPLLALDTAALAAVAMLDLLGFLALLLGAGGE